MGVSLKIKYTYTLNSKNMCLLAIVTVLVTGHHLFYLSLDGKELPTSLSCWDMAY